LVRKRFRIVGICALVVLLVGAGSAAALRLTLGNVVVVTDGGFTPTTLPKHHFAPIRLHGYGKISTSDGKLPPILEKLTIWFDKHGEVVTKGLPICTAGKLQATTPSVARKNCSGSIVGEGYGTAVIAFPEQKPFTASSPITIFNGPPKHGNPTVLAHAYLGVPAPTTYIVPIEIQRVHDGRYGFKTEATIPKIAGGAGIPLYGRLRIGREWTYKGKRLSYANASCADGRLQGKVQTTFKDGTFLEGTIIKACKGR
jgi:hypothetical protein